MRFWPVTQVVTNWTLPMRLVEAHWESAQRRAVKSKMGPVLGSGIIVTSAVTSLGGSLGPVLDPSLKNAPRSLTRASDGEVFAAQACAVACVTVACTTNTESPPGLFRRSRVEAKPAWPLLDEVVP